MLAPFDSVTVQSLVAGALLLYFLALGVIL